MSIIRNDFSPLLEPIEKGLSTNRPLNPVVGRHRYEYDTLELVAWNGSIWEVIGPSTGSGGAPTTVDYLVGTTDAGLSNEIVVGPTPGGELGGTWASPTVDASHSGSTHAAVQAAAEATAAGALAGHAGAADPHTGYQKESEKGAASGYASLDAGTTVPDAQIPAAIARDTEVTAAIDARLSAVNATDLTDGGSTTLHSHAAVAGDISNIISSNKTVANGTSVYYPMYCEVAAGVNLEVAVDGWVEVG